MQLLHAVLVFQPASGDPAAAIKHLSYRSNAAASAGADPLVVHLHKARPKVLAGSAVPDSVNLYVGSIFVGSHDPQEFKVIFDTSSGHLLLPHYRCQSSSCKEHRQYEPKKSHTAVDVNADGSPVQKGKRIATGKVTRDVVTVEFTQADLGTGAAQGVLVQDEVCIRAEAKTIGRTCTNVAVLAAIKMEDAPFRVMPSDGIIGLGLSSLSTSPMCNFLQRFLAASPGMLPQFGMTLGPDSGELYLGGQNPASMTGPLQWFPVTQPADGLWQVQIKAVRVGGRTVDRCHGGCRGVVDTSASHLGVQQASLPKLVAALVASPDANGVCSGPDLEIILDGLTICLQAQDYGDASCKPALGPLMLEEPKDGGVYVFGETVLRHFYAAFDWEALRVGFAPRFNGSTCGAAWQDSAETVIDV